MDQKTKEFAELLATLTPESLRLVAEILDEYKANQAKAHQG